MLITGPTSRCHPAPTFSPQGISVIDLHGEVAILAGAASYHDDDPYQVGQGVATARTLARLGAAFVLADINSAVAAKCVQLRGSDAGPERSP